MIRMTAASTYGSPQKLPWGCSARRTFFSWEETGVLGEGMDACSQGARRGMGPSTYARVAEIMSGRTISQQGLAATCKDLAHKGYPEAREGIWSDAWARRSEDGEATLSQMTLEVIPTGSNGSGGQRSPGHSVAVVQGRREEMAVWPNLAHRNVSGGLVLVIHGEGLDKPVSQGRTRASV